MSELAFESLAASRRSSFYDYMTMMHQVFLPMSSKDAFLEALRKECEVAMNIWPQMSNLLKHSRHYNLEFMPEEYSVGQDIAAEARYFCNVMMRNLIYVETMDDTDAEFVMATDRADSMDTEREASPRTVDESGFGDCNSVDV